MINYSNNDVIVAPDGKWLDVGIAPPVRYYVYTSAEHGTVTAQPNSGYTYDTVTLSNSADTGYRFSSYTYTGTGASLSGNTLTIGTSDVHVIGNFEEYVDPYNPLNLPPYTIRFKIVPHSSYPDYWPNEVEIVDEDNGIFQICIPKNNWSLEFREIPNLLEIVGVNSTGVTNMDGLFSYNSRLRSVPLFDTSTVTNIGRIYCECPSLTSIPAYDTSNVTTMEAAFGKSGITTTPNIDVSNVTNIRGAFAYCSSLTTVGSLNTSKATDMSSLFAFCTSLESVPLLNTSKATNVNNMFDGCVNVIDGAHALYLQMSGQTTPPANHSYTFRDCGTNTMRGQYELQLIPSDWK